MDDELTNLLPLERLKEVRTKYFTRLAVVAIVLTTLLIIVAGVLLIPTYVFLTQKVTEKESQLAAIESTVPDVDQKALIDRLATLTSNTKALTDLASAPAVDAILKSILAVPHLGITLVGFSYTPSKTTPKPVPGTLVINGMSQTRDTLRAFQLALQGVPFVSAAALPVSAYAQSSDIPFSVTLTLTP